jgi:hypothetical protein
VLLPSPKRVQHTLRILGTASRRAYAVRAYGLGLRCPADDCLFARHLPGRANRRAGERCRLCGCQLGIRDVACLADYAARPTTAWDHAAEIRRIYIYRDFTDPAESFRLLRWLYTRAWLSSEQASVLFDLATARLVERRQVLLPGVSILERRPP